MSTQNFCSQCGNKLAPHSLICSTCGRKNTPSAVSAKSPLKTLLLCIFFGTLGLHRFYVGKITTGILMLLTFGGLGIWTLVDVTLIASSEFKDNQGNKLEFTSSASSTPKQALMIIASALGALVVYVFLIVTLAFYLTSGLVTVVNNQLAALRVANYEKAYSYTSRDFQHAVSLDKFKTFVDTYPSLKNNKSVTFYSREFNNDKGSIEGTLYSNDGATTPIKYLLVRENNTWKILSIVVNPTGVGTEINKSESSDSVNKTTHNNMQLFQNKSSRYSVQYPNSWKYGEPAKGTVIFRSKTMQKPHLANVNIQTILSTKSGGHFANIDAFIKDLKNQIAKIPNSKIIEEGDIELPRDPKNYAGKFMIVTYTYNNIPIKQMQFVISRKDGLLFYSWGYTANAKDYDNYLPLAKSIFESWEIY